MCKSLGDGVLVLELQAVWSGLGQTELTPSLGAVHLLGHLGQMA